MINHTLRFMPLEISHEVYKRNEFYRLFSAKCSLQIIFSQRASGVAVGRNKRR